MIVLDQIIQLVSKIGVVSLLIAQQMLHIVQFQNIVNVVHVLATPNALLVEMALVVFQNLIFVMDQVNAKTILMRLSKIVVLTNSVFTLKSYVIRLSNVLNQNLQLQVLVTQIQTLLLLGVNQQQGIYS